MEADSATVQLGIQLAAAAAMMFVMTFVHGIGLVVISRLLNLKSDRLKEHDFDFGAVMLMCMLALSIFALHTLEIWLFAAFYLAVDALHTLEEALYYSASAYATLGRTAEYFPHDWRLLGAVEALIGFILIGWSTAFIVRHVNRLRE